MKPFDLEAAKRGVTLTDDGNKTDQKKNFDVDEFNLELNAGFAAQNYCGSLWGAARGHSNWRKIHEAFVAGYKAAPPQREWVGLTEDEITELFCDYDASQFPKFVRTVEAKLREKNAYGSQPINDPSEWLD